MPVTPLSFLHGHQGKGWTCKKQLFQLIIEMTHY